MWERLLKRGLKEQFAELFQRYAIRYVMLNWKFKSASTEQLEMHSRTMKATICDELTIPQQTRYLVSIELGPIERDVSWVISARLRSSFHWSIAL